MFSLPEFKEQSRLERKEYITLFWGGGQIKNGKLSFKHLSSKYGSLMGRLDTFFNRIHLSGNL